MAGSQTAAELDSEYGMPFDWHACTISEKRLNQMQIQITEKNEYYYNWGNAVTIPRKMRLGMIFQKLNDNIRSFGNYMNNILKFLCSAGKSGWNKSMG